MKLPEINDGFWDKLRRLILSGRIRPEARKRARPHSRRYTKRYADGRQKRGGKLFALEARRLKRR